MLTVSSRRWPSMSAYRPSAPLCTRPHHTFEMKSSSSLVEYVACHWPPRRAQLLPDQSTHLQQAQAALQRAAGQEELHALRCQTPGALRACAGYGIARGCARSLPAASRLCRAVQHSPGRPS
jgi:hypothetical protein